MWAIRKWQRPKIGELDTYGSTPHLDHCRGLWRRALERPHDIEAGAGGTSRKSGDQFSVGRYIEA
jgi:hypothetical protein